MPVERRLTRCESFGLNQGLTETLCQWDQSKSYPLTGKVGARAVGVLMTPIVSIIDALVHAILFASKLAVSAALLPYNFVATLFIPSIALPKDLEVSSSLIHLTRVAECIVGAAILPVLSLTDPGRAYSIANHKKYLPEETDSTKKTLKANKGLQKAKRSAKNTAGKGAAHQSKETELKALNQEIEAQSKILDEALKKSRANKAAQELVAPIDHVDSFGLGREVHRGDYWKGIDLILDEIDGEVASEGDAERELEELDALLTGPQATPQKKKSDFKYEKTKEPEPKKLQMEQSDFSLLQASLSLKKKLSDKLQKSKAKPGLSELVPEAVRQAKPLILANKEEVAASLKKKEEELILEGEEKIAILKPVYGNVMEELQAKGASSLKKTKNAGGKENLGPVNAKPALMFSDLTFAARKKLMEQLGSDIGEINEFLASLSEDEARVLFGKDLVASAKDQVDQPEDEFFDIELESTPDFSMSIDSFDHQESEGSLPVAEPIPFNAPSDFMKEAEQIARFIMKGSWEQSRVEMEERREEMMNMLASVRLFNREWSLNSSLPSPYALAEEKIFKLACMIELDRDTHLMNYSTSSLSSIVKLAEEADAEGLRSLSMLQHLEEAAALFVRVNLCCKLILENPSNWETGLNARLLIQANESLLNIQKIAVREEMAYRLNRMIEEAEDTIESATTLSFSEILDLPLASQEETTPSQPLPFSLKTRENLARVLSDVKEGRTDLFTGLRTRATLLEEWKGYGIELSGAVEYLMNLLYKEDKSLYLQGELKESETVKKAVKELHRVRMITWMMQYKTHDALGANHEKRMNALRESMVHLQEMPSENEKEEAVLEAIYQEALRYEIQGYQEKPFKTEATVGQMLDTIEKEADDLEEAGRESYRESLTGLIKKAIASYAQWEFETGRLES